MTPAELAKLREQQALPWRTGHPQTLGFALALAQHAEYLLGLAERDLKGAHSG